MLWPRLKEPMNSSLSSVGYLDILGWLFLITLLRWLPLTLLRLVLKLVDIPMMAMSWQPPYREGALPHPVLQPRVGSGAGWSIHLPWLSTVHILETEDPHGWPGPLNSHNSALYSVRSQVTWDWEATHLPLPASVATPGESEIWRIGFLQLITCIVVSVFQSMRDLFHVSGRQAEWINFNPEEVISTVCFKVAGRKEWGLLLNIRTPLSG